MIVLYHHVQVDDDEDLKKMVEKLTKAVQESNNAISRINAPNMRANERYK